jgi:hypothetical protein
MIERRKIMTEKQTNSTLPSPDLDFGVDDDLLADDKPLVMPAKVISDMPGIDFAEFEAGIEDVNKSDYIKALIYGLNGTGKTTFAGTWPKPLVLDFNERGTWPLKGTDARQRKVDTFEMFQMAYWFLKSGKHNFETVVLDTVTLWQDIVLRYIMGKERLWDTNKDLDMPSQRDYGGLSNVAKRWLLEFRNLPMNVIFIAQEKRANDDDLDSDDITIFPQMTGSVRSVLGGAVDLIGYTYTREVESPNNPGVKSMKFCMGLMTNGKYLAKIRVPRGAETPRAIINPNYEIIRKIMEGTYNAKV